MSLLKEGSRVQRAPRPSSAGPHACGGQVEAAPARRRAVARPAPAVAQSFPWHSVLLSQQPRDGPALGSAASWRRAVDFLAVPEASTYLKACPGPLSGLDLSQVHGAVRGLERVASVGAQGPAGAPRVIPTGTGPLTASLPRASGTPRASNSKLALQCPESKMPPLLPVNINTAVKVEGGCVLSHFSCVELSLTPWTAAHQAPLSMGFSRQEHWSGLPYPPPGDLPNSETEPVFQDSCVGRRVLYHYAAWEGD